MKTLFFISLITLTLSAQGQAYVYKPFPTSYGKWVYDFHDGLLHFDNNEVTKSTLYELQNDTTISSVSYKKISMDGAYKGALREQDQRIYFYPDTATKEYVLYDFNLVVGDVITVFAGNYNATTATLVSIDYITASDGTHKRFHFQNYTSDLTQTGNSTWIEGIGSFNGLLRPNLTNGYWQFTYQDELKCMTSDLPFQYPAGADPCVLTGTRQETASETMSIFPNPSNSSFTIDFKNQLVKEVSVSDVLGSVIFRGNVNQEKNYTIPALKTGTYVLSIIDINNRIVHEKIVSAP